MSKIRVTYDVQQPYREVDVSDEAVKYFRLIKDGSFTFGDDIKKKAVEEIIAKLQEFHPEQRIEVVDVEIL